MSVHGLHVTADNPCGTDRHPSRSGGWVPSGKGDVLANARELHDAMPNEF